VRLILMLLLPIVTVGALSTATRELPLYRRFFVVPAREFLSRGAKTGLVTNTISQRDSKRLDANSSCTSVTF